MASKFKNLRKGRLLLIIMNQVNLFKNISLKMGQKLYIQRLSLGDIYQVELNLQEMVGLV